MRRLTLSLLPIIAMCVWSHVVFEEIGQMSGSTSYVHLSVTVDLAGIEDKILTFSKYISQYQALINTTYAKARKDFDDECKTLKANYKPCDDAWRRQMDRDQARYLHMASTFQHDAGQLKSRIRNLRGILPSPFPSTAKDNEKVDLNSEYREKRSVLTRIGGLLFKAAKHGMIRKVRSPSLLFSLARGILGTFMGMYTQHQIDKLRTQVGELREDHNQLVEVVAENRASIVRLENQMVGLNRTLTILSKLNSGIVVSEISSM